MQVHLIAICNNVKLLISIVKLILVITEITKIALLFRGAIWVKKGLLLWEHKMRIRKQWIKGYGDGFIYPFTHFPSAHV